MFNFKSASIAELRKFASENSLVIEGDRRLRSTYEKAIALFISIKDQASAFLDSQEMSEIKAAASEAAQEAIAQTSAKVKEVVTAENAMKATMLTARVLWSITLVAIAIVVLAIDWAKDRDVRSAIVALVKHYAKRSVSTWQFLEAGGYCAVKYHVIDRVLNMRDRIAQITGAAIAE